MLNNVNIMKRIKMFLKFKKLSLSIDNVSDWLLFFALCLFVAYMLIKFWLQSMLLVCLFL